MFTLDPFLTGLWDGPVSVAGGPPPDPDPVGAWLILDGVAYRVIADEPSVVPQAAVAGEWVRAFDGSLRSIYGAPAGAAVAARRTLRCTLYDLTAAEYAALRGTLANRRRALVGGTVWGGAVLRMVGTADEVTVRYWKGGTEAVRRRVRLVLEEA